MTPNIVYGLIDPRSGELRYIGKSENGLVRAKSHRYNMGKDRNIPKAEWILSLAKEGLNYDIWVMHEQEKPAGLNEAEREAIELYRALGCNLLNRSEGGDGGRKRQVHRPKPRSSLPPYREWKRQQEDLYFSRLGEELGWNMVTMAQMSGLHRSTLYDKLAELGIQL